MNNSKDIVPFWNKARQAMQDISFLLEEAEKETLKKLKDQIGSLTLTLPTRKGTGKQVSPCGGDLEEASSFLLSDFDINFGTLGQRIDLYFFDSRVYSCTNNDSVYLIELVVGLQRTGLALT